MFELYYYWCMALEKTAVTAAKCTTKLQALYKLTHFHSLQLYNVKIFKYIIYKQALYTE